MENKFEKLIEECIINKQYVGLGNPESKILFIGKEAGSNQIFEELSHGSGQKWKTNDYSNRIKPKADNQNEKVLKNGNHTWQKYQKLFEFIFSEQIKLGQIKSKTCKYEITFVEQVFTTELSNIPSKTSSLAKKNKNFISELNKRKREFFKHEFIQKFPIILIFALDNKYIETYSGEVCKLFNVNFVQSKEVANSKYWIHNNIDGDPKLLIHTRQLTNGAPNMLLEEIANHIKEFIKKYNIDIVIK